MTLRKVLFVPLVLSLLPVFQSISFNVYSQQQDISSQQGLFNRWKDNRETNHRIAYEAAKEYLRKYSSDQSENAEFMRRWVAAYEKTTNSLVQAPTNEVSVADKIPAERRYEKAKSHIRLQEWSEAEDELRKAVLLEPGNGAYREALANILVKNQKFSEAENHYKLLVNDSPENAGYRLLFAESLAKQQKWSESENQYNKYYILMDGRGKDVEYAEVLFQLKKYDQAEEIYVRIRDRDRPDVSFKLGELYAAQEKWELATYSFFDSVHLSPDNKEYRSRLELAEEKARGGQNVESLADTEWHVIKFVSEQYTSEFIYNFFPDGRVVEVQDADKKFVVTGQYQWKQKGRIIYTEFGRGTVGINRANVGLLQGDKIFFHAQWWSPTITLVRSGAAYSERMESRLVSSHPGSSGFYYMAGESLISGNMTKAEKYFKKSLEGSDFSSHASYFGLALALAKQSNWEEARRMIEKAIQGIKKQCDGCKDRLSTYRSVQEKIGLRQDLDLDLFHKKGR